MKQSQRSKLHFINYRCPSGPADMQDFEKKQILFDFHRDGLLPKDEDIDDALTKLIEDDEISGLELVDVADESGKILYQAWFYDYGSAMFFENQTINEVGGACQHGVDCKDKKLQKALKIAYENATHKIFQSMDFS